MLMLVLALSASLHSMVIMGTYVCQYVNSISISNGMQSLLFCYCVTAWSISSMHADVELTGAFQSFALLSVTWHC
jgi:hypothetical protein